jgi:hypothetical protein
MREEIISTAKRLCEAGIYIFPTKIHKTPATPHGYNDASTSFDEFLKYYENGYGIGIVTGESNNIYVIDMDVEKDQNGNPILENNEPIKTGFNSFKEIFHINAIKEMNTYTVETPSGGYHIYYKLKKDQTPLKTHITVLKKIDLKGNGGYIVAPPSIIATGEYQVINDVEIAEMPDILYEFWHSLDFPDEDDTHEIIYPVVFNDDTINLLENTLYEILKKQSGLRNHLLMAISGALALREFTEEQTQTILGNVISRIPDLNHPEWKSIIKLAYEKFMHKQKIIGYTTLLSDIEKITDKLENYDEIEKNLKIIFENNNKKENPLCNDKGIFDKGRAIDFVMRKFKALYSDDFENLYSFSSIDGWHNKVENEIKHYIQKIDKTLSEHYVNEIIYGIKHITFDNNFKDNLLPNRFIALNSGLFDVEKHKIVEHNRNYFYNNINRNYISGVKEESMALSKFLTNVLRNPEDRTIIYESIAWALLNVNNFQGMIIFYGEGGNGKGILLNSVIANLLGHENVAMPDLSRIANYPFELQGLISKKALLFSESVKGVTYNWEILKRITGHDYENIPIKNKPPMQYQYQSAVFLSTNELIPPKDEIAIWRRIINIIEFSDYLNNLTSDEISKIVADLSDPAELDKVFSFIIDQIYSRFMEHGFSNRFNIKTAKEKYLMKSNPAITYLVLKEKNGEILTNPDEVIDFCKTHGYDQDKCYSIDKSGNEVIFQIKEQLMDQVNKFCEKNRLPKYDPQDRNSQTKIGQAMHYLGFNVYEYRKRLNGNLIHAWAGVFITTDDVAPNVPDDIENHKAEESHTLKECHYFRSEEYFPDSFFHECGIQNVEYKQAGNMHYYKIPYEELLENKYFEFSSRFPSNRKVHVIDDKEFDSINMEDGK